MDDPSCRTEQVAPSVATEPPTPVKTGGDAVVVNNDAPAYSTHLESEEGQIGGWRKMFISNDPVVQNYRYLTTLSYLLGSIVVCGLIFGKVREEGIYADEYLWMRYQTLLTPASYTDYIWIPLIVLQGLFIYGTLLPFKNSTLVGYTALKTPIENTAERTKLYINCPIIHYPGMCAMIMFMVYSYDREYMVFATVFAILATLICFKIVSLQLQVLAGTDNAAVSNEEARTDICAEVRSSTVGFLHEYIFLRLPFELSGGYTVCLAFMYLNSWLHVFGLNSKALFVCANTSILSLLVIAAYVLWGLKQGNGRHLYGCVASMVWYLVGVAVELQTPSQPIYNQFSDSQIMITQILAALASTVLSSLVAIRVIKTVIKRNMFNCMGCQGKDSDVVEEDITSDYVHA